MSPSDDHHILIIRPTGLRDVVMGLYVAVVRRTDWLSGSTWSCFELHAARTGTLPRMCHVPAPLPSTMPYLTR